MAGILLISVWLLKWVRLLHTRILHAFLSYSYSTARAFFFQISRWPAVGDDFKISIGLLPDPEAAASSSADSSSSSSEPLVELSAEAQEKVDNAYKSHDQLAEEKMSDEEKAVLAKIEAGDLSALDSDWDSFMEKSIKPGEDDDDEDEDDEDDEVG